MAHLNIEIKAKCSNPKRIREILMEYEAEYKGTDHQVDTYFVVPNGRLKLREGNIENNLIHYIRPDQDGPKASEVTLVPTGKNSELKSCLTKALGVKVVVDKQREIYFIENVKFHIDEVKGLGNFVEIEAIDQKNLRMKKILLGQCNYYMGLFEIPEEDLISESYSDLILSK